MVHGTEAIMEGAELAVDASIVAGEAVEVGNDGFGCRGFAGSAEYCEVLDFVEAVEAEVLNSDAVNETLFGFGLGVVVFLEGGADFV
jgi:hypothetical protein